MKQVFLFKLHGENKADKLEEIRAQIKGQIADGVVVFGGETEFIGVFSEPPEPRPLLPVIAPDVLSAVPEAEGLEISLMRRRIERVSLAEMKAAIAAGRGREIIRPRDEFEIKLDTGETVTAVCGGYIGDRRARFIFKDAHKRGVMNDEATNEGGYFKSKGRKHVLENIYPHLPPELRAVIEPRPLVEIIGGEKVEYSDPLWLPSATDVFGPREWWPEEPDSVQLEIFKTERGRVKELDGETVIWWLRSPRAGYSSSFVSVDADGTVNGNGAYNSLAFAPGFDL